MKPHLLLLDFQLLARLVVHVESQFFRLLLVHAVSCLCSTDAAAFTVVAAEETNGVASFLLRVLYHGESLLRVAVVIRLLNYLLILLMEGYRALIVAEVRFRTRHREHFIHRLPQFSWHTGFALVFLGILGVK